MKLIAVDKGRKRLRQAADHLRSVEHLTVRIPQPNAPLSGHVAAFEAAWYGFLSALNSVLEVLVTGGKKGTPESKEWILAKRREVLSDPLLGYLFQARAAEFHGLDVSPAMALGQATISGFASATIQLEGGALQTIEVPVLHGGPDTNVGDSIDFTPSFKLVTVNDDRHGNAFHPPTSHRGLLLADVSPLGVGRVAMAYYGELLAQAEAFCA